MFVWLCNVVFPIHLHACLSAMYHFTILRLDEYITDLSSSCMTTSCANSHITYLVLMQLSRHFSTLLNCSRMPTKITANNWSWRRKRHRKRLKLKRGRSPTQRKSHRIHNHRLMELKGNRRCFRH